MPLYNPICLHSACLQCQCCQYSSAQSTANPGTLLTDYSTDSPDERVNSVETAHSDRKDRALSDEAYPAERSHGQSRNELSALLIALLMVKTVVQPRRPNFAYEYGAGCRHACHIVWRPMYDKSFGWLLSTRDWVHKAHSEEPRLLQIRISMRYVSIIFRMGWTPV